MPKKPHKTRSLRRISYHRCVALTSAAFLVAVLVVAATVGNPPAEFYFLVTAGLVLAGACWIFESKLIDFVERLYEWELVLGGIELLIWGSICGATALAARGAF